jgi:phosphatidate cytidylyltransferase
LFSPTGPTRPTKSAIRKAHKLARIERKKRQKLEAREKAKHSLAPDTSISPEPELSADEPIGEKQDLSEPSQIPQPTFTPDVPVPAVAVSSDSFSVSAPMVLKGTPHPPLPDPPARQDPIVITNVSPAPEVEQQPQTGSAVHEIQKSTEAEKDKAKKRQNVLNRILWSLVMIGVFVGRVIFEELCTNSDYFRSTFASWTYLHDSARHPVPNTSVQGGDRPLFFEE